MTALVVETRFFEMQSIDYSRNCRLELLNPDSSSLPALIVNNYQVSPFDVPKKIASWTFQLLRFPSTEDSSLKRELPLMNYPNFEALSVAYNMLWLIPDRTFQQNLEKYSVKCLIPPLRQCWWPTVCFARPRNTEMSIYISMQSHRRCYRHILWWCVICRTLQPDILSGNTDLCHK